MLRGITILSPHRDDAVFSVFLCLTRWSRLGIQLRVINFFTVSSYAPHAPFRDAANVSFIRQREDRKALRRTGPAIKVSDAHLADAPIRLNISEHDISKPETRSLLTDDQIETVARQIKGLPRDSLVLAPLALGDHVDHFAVRTAATRYIAPRRIAFYEDLPYATWTSQRALEARVADTGNEIKSHLNAAIVRSPHAVWHKRKAALMYESQITRGEGIAIASWAAQYGGGERIWAPANSDGWRSVLEKSNAAVSQ